MKNPTEATLAAAYKMRKDGASLKTVLSQTWDNEKGKPVPATSAKAERLSYSQFWLYAARQDLDPKLDLAKTPAEKLPAAVVERRNAGYSWGEIAVQANLPESRIRKLYETETDKRSKGQRTGQGGRFLANEQLFYDGDRKVSGTVIPVEKPISAAREEVLKGISQARTRRAATKTAKSAAPTGKRAAKATKSTKAA